MLTKIKESIIESFERFTPWKHKTYKNLVPFACIAIVIYLLDYGIWPGIIYIMAYLAACFMATWFLMFIVILIFKIREDKKGPEK